MTREKLLDMNILINDIDVVKNMKKVFDSNDIDVINELHMRVNINAQSLDEKTFEEWQKLNREFFEKRIKELEEEFERM